MYLHRSSCCSSERIKNERRTLCRHREHRRVGIYTASRMRATLQLQPSREVREPHDATLAGSLSFEACLRGNVSWIEWIVAFSGRMGKKEIKSQIVRGCIRLRGGGIRGCWHAVWLGHLAENSLEALRRAAFFDRMGCSVGVGGRNKLIGQARLQGQGSGMM